MGTAQGDTLTGTNRADSIKARGGVDNVAARGGNDKASGGSGGDILEGGAGNDTLNAGANGDTELEALVGGAGDDILVESPGPDRHVFGAGWGQDRITGDGDPLPRTDQDDVCFNCGPAPATDGVTIDLAAGQAFETAAGPAGPNAVTWTAGIVEHAVGGTGPDTITGSDRSNVVNGSAGADSINVAGDGGGDFVNCGGADGVADTVTRDAGDTIQGSSCDGDRIVIAP